MRTLTDHKINGLNEAIEITVLDEPGQWGACHVYEINVKGRSAEPAKYDGPVVQTTQIKFQNGPIRKP